MFASGSPRRRIVVVVGSPAVSSVAFERPSGGMGPWCLRKWSQGWIPITTDRMACQASNSVPAHAVSPTDPSLGHLDPDGHRPREVLEARHLSLAFGSKRVLDDVCMPFARGTITALIGPTGSGKSTFLRTLNRLNDKVRDFTWEGDVLFDGKSLWQPGRDLLELRRRVGMLFQRPNPFPMSIRDNVVAGVKAHRIARGKQLGYIAEERLRQVGLWEAVRDRLGDSPFRLSGGQQQLLCLARALAVGPEVLLLDEPTSSLDPFATESVEALVKELAPALTLIVVTHNLGQARRISTSTMLFFQGALMEHGPTEQIFDHPRQKPPSSTSVGRIG